MSNDRKNTVLTWNKPNIICTYFSTTSGHTCL